MSENTPSPPLPDAPPEGGTLRDKFDAMLLDSSDVVNYDFPDNRGINAAEDVLALSGVDDALLKDCIVDVSASVWGVPTDSWNGINVFSEACMRKPDPSLLNNM